jgi:hypothetical protein
MPDFDHNADIKIHHDADLVTAEIPLADHASSHWIALFHKLAEQRWRSRAPAAEAQDRPDCTWVIVTTPVAGPASDPLALLDDVSAVIREANASEQQSNSVAALVEATIRDWWVRQELAGDSNS